MAVPCSLTQNPLTVKQESTESWCCAYGVCVLLVTATYFIIGPKDGGREKNSALQDSAESQTLCDSSHRNSIPTTSLTAESAGNNGDAVYQSTTAADDQRLEDSGLSKVSSTYCVH